MTDCDVIIVGAGPSGLGVGALLAHAGKKVLVLEKESRIGGRAFSTTHKGHVVDNSPHAYVREGNLEEIFARLGRPFPKVIPCVTEGTAIYQNGKWVNAMDMLDRKGFRKIMGEIAACSYEELEQYDDVSLKDWVSARTDDEFIHLLFWGVAVGAYAGARYEPFSAGENLFFLKEMLDKYGGLSDMYGYFEGGYSAITQGLYQALIEKGGEVRTNSRVRQILVENGQACGVEVEVGEKLVPSYVVDTEVIRAPIVVCTLPLWDLFNVLNPEDIPRWYADWVEGIKKRYAMLAALTVGLDRPVEGHRETEGGFVAPEYTRSGMILCTNYVPFGAPGEYVLVGWWMGNYDECPINLLEMDKAKTWPQLKKLWDSFEQDFRDIFPDLEGHILWEERYIAPFSLACTPGMVGKSRPTMQIPGVDKLYLVSEGVREARGVASQMMAKAALTCVDRILGKQ